MLVDTWKRGGGGSESGADCVWRWRQSGMVLPKSQTNVKKRSRNMALTVIVQPGNIV